MKHQLELREDTVHVTVHGALDIEVLETALQHYEQILTKHPYFFVIADVSDMTGIPAESRRRAGNWPHSARCGGNALYGAGFLARTLVTMVARSVHLFLRINVPVVFVANEQEAWAWVARRKKELGLPPPAE